jgi:tripartite-type tricarboxylate transporter receptor subunit TctC
MIAFRQLTASFVAALLATAMLPVSASAQDFPTRTVRIVVAFPAGGPTDFVARLLADKLKSLLGQSVLVENKAGANGTLGAEYVARGEPDGHLLFLTTAGAVTISPHLVAKLAYDPIKDFAPVTLVVRNTTVLVVKPETPVGSAKELAALAVKRPGVIPFGSTGTGSITHLALELFQSAAGVKFLHVPYRGAAPLVTDLLGGQIQAMFGDAPVLMPHIKAGALKPLGAAADARNAVLPDVSTLAEQGFPNTTADNWYGLLAPVKTPQVVVAKLHDATVAAINAPEVRAKLVQSGAVPAPTSSAEFGSMLASELARWGRVVRDQNIKDE